MGIQGLAKYINSSYNWTNVSLRGCPIVLDGNALPYYLSKRAELEWRYGGQYPALRRVMESFFDTLLKQEVQPIHIVFDGVDPNEKLEKLKLRKENYLKTCMEGIDGVDGAHQREILPPLVTEAYRKFLEDYNRDHGALKIYSADTEADCLAVIIANKYDCILVGEDSDFYIAALHKGFVPLSKLTWDRPGSPVTGKAYYRDAFAVSLGISPELILAIPAIVGNDSIANLVEETSLKHKIRDNPRYRGKDTDKTILFLKRQQTMETLKQSFRALHDWREVTGRFSENMSQARVMYEGIQPFSEEDFKMHCSYKAKNGDDFPAWMIEQYRDFKFSKNFFEVLMRGSYFFRIIPDDYRKQSTKIFSRPIRQEMYGIMEVMGNVREVVREEKSLAIQPVTPKKSDLSIFKMNEVSPDVKIQKLCNVLLCDAHTLSSLDHMWYIAIASVCYWAKEARIPRDDLKIKALLLCFAECYNKDEAKFAPVYSVDILHSFTQWQCVYHDAILLNQVLALPLPYLSPAFLFDGKRVTWYCQNMERSFDALVAGVSREIRSLYESLLQAVRNNM